MNRFVLPSFPEGPDSQFLVPIDMLGFPVHTDSAVDWQWMTRAEVEEKFSLLNWLHSLPRHR